MESKMDENDIIIKLAQDLRERFFTSSNVSVTYSLVDEQNGLPEGSTKKYLEVATKQIGAEIVLTGATMASLHR